MSPDVLLPGPQDAGGEERFGDDIEQTGPSDMERNHDGAEPHMSALIGTTPAAATEPESNIVDAENQAQQAPVMDNGSAAASGVVQTVAAGPSAPHIATGAEAAPAFPEEAPAPDAAVAGSTGAVTEETTNAPVDTGAHEGDNDQPVQVSCREAGISRMCIYFWTSCSKRTGSSVCGKVSRTK
jgi:hypothetical protein